MRLIAVCVLCFMIGTRGSLQAQCDSRDSLWARVNAIRTSGRSVSEKLKEFLDCKRVTEKCPGNSDSVYAYLLVNIGLAYYKLADYVNAIQYEKKAINVIQSNINSDAVNAMWLPKRYYFLSVYYDSLGLAAQKNEAIDSCISTETKFSNDHLYSAIVLGANVRDLFIKGDYNLCVDRATLGEELLHRSYKFSDSLTQITFFIYYKARSLGFLGRYDEEAEFLRSKSTYLQRLSDKDFRGNVYILFGQLYKGKRDYENAIKSFQRAFYYDMLSSRKEMSASILNQIGLVYSENKGEYRLALQYYYKALAHSQSAKIGDVIFSDSFYILAGIANVYARMKLFDSAYYFFQKAFDKIKPGINEKDFVVHIQDYVTQNNVEDVLRLVLDKGDAFLNDYYYNKREISLQQSLSVYREADKLLNGIKIQLGELQSKLFWRSYSKRLYEHAIKASFLEENAADAFYYFEKSRAVILSDEIKEENKIGEADALRLAELKRKILLLKRQRDSTDISSDGYVKVQNNLVASQLELHKTEQTIQQNNPLYHQSFFDTSLISLRDIQGRLSNSQQTLVEIFDGDSAVYLIIVDPKKCFLQIVDRVRFDSLSAAFIQYLSHKDLLNRDFKGYLQSSHRLYQLLFNNHILPAGRVIISPDGKYFPFEALIVHTQPLTYFLDDYAVSYAYSARYLLEAFNSAASRYDRTFLGFAPVTFARLPELAGSDQSLNRIQGYFSKANNFIQNDASKRNFLNEFYQYQIIQLYTHATDSGYTNEPMIYFSDSTLNLSDLVPEKRPATNLIVLSACETASGKLYSGEGVFSFNRGFASLGIPSCVSSLWQVDNKSTYRLTELFYKYVTGGMPLDLALQKAKKDFRTSTDLEEERLPYYWAAAILVGKTDPIAIQRHSEWEWVMIVSCLAIILSVFLVRLWKIRTRKFNVQ